MTKRFIVPRRHSRRPLRMCGSGHRRRLVVARSAAFRCRHRRWRAGEKLYCVSYAPFRGTQSPLHAADRASSPGRSTKILRGFRRLTDCVRTYSIEYGLDQIAGDRPAARAEGDAGLWLSGNADKNQLEIDTDRRARQAISRT